MFGTSAHTKRSVLVPQPASDKKIVRRWAGTSDPGNGNVTRQTVARTVQVRNDRPDIRFTEQLVAVHLAARQRVHLAQQVIIAVVRKTADDRQAISDLGQPRQRFTELHARQSGFDRRQLTTDLLGGLWLGIKRIDVGHATTDPQVDHRLGPTRCSLGSKSPVQAKPSQHRGRNPQGTGLQHIAPRPLPEFIARGLVLVMHNAIHYAA